MELKKTEKSTGGFLAMLFRTLLEHRGVKHKLVHEIANKRMYLNEKDFTSLKRLVKEPSLTFKSFVWLLIVLLNVRRMTIRITTEDKDGNINEASLSTDLIAEGVVKDKD